VFPRKKSFVTANFKSLACNLGSGLAIDAVHYLRGLEEVRPLTQWSCEHWLAFFSSPKSERFLAILFAIRNYLRDLPLLLFFQDHFPDWDNRFGSGLYPISVGSPCADLMARKRSVWAGPICEVLSSKKSVATEGLRTVSALKLRVESDYVDFYDVPTVSTAEAGVVFERWKADELDRLEVDLFFRESFPDKRMPFYSVQSALNQFAGRDQGWWVYKYPKVRHPDDYRAVRTSDLLKSAVRESWCSPLEDRVLNGDGMWKTLVLIGHLSWFVSHDAQGRDTVRMRVSDLDDYQLGLVSPVLVLRMFQPFGGDGSHLICDATRREPLLPEYALLSKQSQLCRNSIALSLHTYGADIESKNKRLKTATTG
jgi:hypothetical protein